MRPQRDELFKDRSTFFFRINAWEWHSSHVITSNSDTSTSTSNNNTNLIQFTFLMMKFNSNNNMNNDSGLFFLSLSSSSVSTVTVEPTEFYYYSRDLRVTWWNSDSKPTKKLKRCDAKTRCHTEIRIEIFVPLIWFVVRWLDSYGQVLDLYSISIRLWTCCTQRSIIIVVVSLSFARSFSLFLFEICLNNELNGRI